MLGAPTGLWVSMRGSFVFACDFRGLGDENRKVDCFRSSFHRLWLKGHSKTRLVKGKIGQTLWSPNGFFLSQSQVFLSQNLLLLSAVASLHAVLFLFECCQDLPETWRF